MQPVDASSELEALERENAELRLELDALRADRPWTDKCVEVTLVRDKTTPAAGRSAVLRALGTDVAATVRADVELVASELLANGVRHGAARGGPIILRIEHSPVTIRIEVADDSVDGVIAVATPDRLTPGGLGLQLVQTLSERWGAERTSTGGTRVWAQLTLMRTPVQ